MLRPEYCLGAIREQTVALGAPELAEDDACALHGCPTYGRCFCVARD
jgi:hypothetical protein